MRKTRELNSRPLRVSFLIPPDHTNFQPFKNQQLTALYLLTILEKTFAERVDLSIIDLRAISPALAKYYLTERDVYLYTAFSPVYQTVCEMRDLLAGLYPESLHVIGGPHVDLFPEQIQGFDAISLGEGEVNIVQIVQDVLAGSLNPVYRHATPVDLNAYPYPLRKFQPFPAVVDTGFFYQDQSWLAANVLFSRGCPFRCNFCANLNLGPTRYRSPELVEEEIQYLKQEYGVQALVLRDDNAVPVNRKIAKPFLQAIGRTGVKWRGQARANGIAEDMVELAASSGCLDLALGIESVTPKVLEIINKKIDLHEAKQFIKMLKKYKIGVKLLLVLGLPGEPDDVVSRTLNFIDETVPDVVGLALFCPYPGSKMTAHYKEFGIKNINPNLHEYQILYSRFDDKEKIRLLFEYEEMTPWGKGMRSETIIENYDNLQESLRKRNLIF